MDSQALDSHTLALPRPLDSPDSPGEPPQVQAIKEAFRAFIEEGVSAGVEALLRVSHPDCLLRPYSAGGRVLHGHEEARAHFSEAMASGMSITVHPRSFECRGDEVVVSGSMRLARPSGGFAETQIRWVYRFRDGLVEEATWGPRQAV